MPPPISPIRALIRHRRRSLVAAAIACGMAAAAFAPLFWTVPWAGWLPPAGLVLGGLALIALLRSEAPAGRRGRAVGPDAAPRTTGSGSVMAALDAVNIGVLRFDSEDLIETVVKIPHFHADQRGNVVSTREPFKVN